MTDPNKRVGRYQDSKPSQARNVNSSIQFDSIHPPPLKPVSGHVTGGASRPLPVKEDATRPGVPLNTSKSDPGGNYQLTRDSLTDFTAPPAESRQKTDLTVIVTDRMNQMSLDEGIGTTVESFVNTASSSSKTPIANVSTTAKATSKTLESAAQTAETDNYYKKAIEKAVHCLAFTNDSNQAMKLLLKFCPQALDSIDDQLYQESPLGQALLRGHADWAKEFLKTVDASTDSNLSERVLTHRNSSRHTLLMLGVDLLDNGASGNRELIERLLDSYPTQVHECYDLEGRNVFHHCAADGKPSTLAAILDWLTKNADRCEPSRVAAALQMPDGRCRTPVHYMAEGGSVEMLKSVYEYAKSNSVKVDFDWHWRGAFDRTPLMLAVLCGHADVCQWLLALDGDSALRPTLRASDTGQAALEMAAEVGRTDIVQILESALSKNSAALSLGDPGVDLGDDVDVDEDEDFGFEEGDCCSASVATASTVDKPTAAAAQQPASGNDLNRLDSAARTRLCEELRKSALYEKFLNRLEDHVPELKANPGFLGLSTDPLYLALSLAAGSRTEGVNRALLAKLLAEIGASDDLAKQLRLFSSDAGGSEL